jgi:hypothetical protein
VRRDDGSVLVEALVSTAVAALVLMAAYQVVEGSAERHALVETRRYALMVARSELAQAGTAIPLTRGGGEGREDGLFWRLDAQPCGPARSTTGVLYCVTVSVRKSVDTPPVVTLASRRLAPAA